MYYLYVRKSNGYSANMVGEFDTIEEARAKAAEEKKYDEGCTYRIEVTNGGFNSYGELLTSIVEKG